MRATSCGGSTRRYLEEAQDDATRLAIDDQERAGLDIVTDGEMRRESYSNRFATALEGVDVDNPGTALDRSGHPNPVPRVVGPVARRHPVQVRDPSSCARTRAARRRSPCPGRSRCPSRPRTTSTARRTRSGWPTRRRCAARSSTSSPPAPTSSRSTSPTCRPGPRRRASTGSTRSSRATDGIDGTIAVHICFGYAAIIHERPSGYSFLPELAATECDQIRIETAQSGLALDVLDSLPEKTIILGVLDLSTDEVETPETVAERSAARSRTRARSD